MVFCSSILGHVSSTVLTSYHLGPAHVFCRRHVDLKFPYIEFVRTVKGEMGLYSSHKQRQGLNCVACAGLKLESSAFLFQVLELY